MISGCKVCVFFSCRLASGCNSSAYISREEHDGIGNLLQYSFVKKNKDTCKRKHVKNAKQYTVPVQAALDAARSGQNPELTTRQKHTRECFVVAEDGADLKQIEKEIVTMPNYFDEYDTTVHFITEEELIKNHSGIPHGGFVIRSGKSSDGINHVIEYSLKLDSNPEFTSSVLVAYARAVYRLNNEGQTGCKTIFDVPPAYLSAKSREELLAHML